MRFFFDFTDGSYVTHDREGHECESAEAARSEALRALSEVLFNEHRDVEFREVLCRVRNERGDIVCQASVAVRAAAVEVVS